MRSVRGEPSVSFWPAGAAREGTRGGEVGERREAWGLGRDRSWDRDIYHDTGTHRNSDHYNHDIKGRISDKCMCMYM